MVSDYLQNLAALPMALDPSDDGRSFGTVRVGAFQVFPMILAYLYAPDSFSSFKSTSIAKIILTSG